MNRQVVRGLFTSKEVSKRRQPTMKTFRSCSRTVLFCLAALAVSTAAYGHAGFAPESDALSAGTALKEMSPGWNLGNTLEALPNETSWGNPVPNLTLFKAVRAAGFKSIRIPVAWSQHADAEYNIDPKWKSHIQDVVTLARRAGLYAMINIHWDGGWLQSTYAKEPAATSKLRKFWSQIAKSFRDFDDHVLFAGTNEIGVDGVYGPPTPENAAVQNGFNQTFVTAVRKTGGNNRTRFLVVQGYSTDIDATVKSNATMPYDTANDRLMMEVHYYSPYNFTLNDKSTIWQWGKNATDPSATETWANEAYVDAEFQKMKATFIDKGVPVILGEYAAGMKSKYPGMDSFRRDWDMYVTKSAFAHGLIPFYWDAGSLFNRRTGVQQDGAVIKLITEAARTSS